MQARTFIAGLLLISFKLQAQSLSTAGVEELDAYLEQAIATTHIPGMVALVVNKDGIVYANAFGLMDTAGNKPMTRDAIFRMASMAAASC